MGRSLLRSDENQEGNQAKTNMTVTGPLSIPPLEGILRRSESGSAASQAADQRGTRSLETHKRTQWVDRRDISNPVFPALSNLGPPSASVSNECDRFWPRFDRPAAPCTHVGSLVSRKSEALLVTRAVIVRDTHQPCPAKWGNLSRGTLVRAAKRSSLRENRHSCR